MASKKNQRIKRPRKKVTAKKRKRTKDKEFLEDIIAGRRTIIDGKISRLIPEWILMEVMRKKTDRERREKTDHSVLELMRRDTFTENDLLIIESKKAEFEGNLHETMQRIADKLELDISEAYTEYHFSPKISELQG